MGISTFISEGEDLILNQGANIFTTPLIQGGSVVQNAGYITKGVEYALNRIKTSNWRFDLGYGFSVEGDPSNKFANLKLQINPSELRQSENFAITVTPCQTGVITEHQGFVIKNLTISGTTGMRPMGAVRTGYAEFMRLRNYLRSYAECKKNPNYKDLKLIFRNKKDNEYWYVEPTGPGVDLRRTQDRPFLYDYTISLIIVGWAEAYPRRGGVYGQILDNITLVENIVDEVGDRIENAAAIIHDSADLLNRISRQVAITLTIPLNKVSAALQAMRYAKTTVSALPRSFYEELKRSAADVRDNFIDLVGLGDSRYNTTFGRTPLSAQKSFILSDVKTLEAVSSIVTGMDRVLASDVIFSPESGSGVLSGTSDNLESAIEINSSAVQATRTASAPSLKAAFKNALDFVLPQSVKEEVIQYNDTLEKIAYRVMADTTLWYQIVLLNNLDPPYISEDPIVGKNTLSYGQTILIPQYGTPDKMAVLQKGDTEITKDLSIFEKNLGVDLQLTNENDIAVNLAAQDFELIAGVENAAQAVNIKLGMEPGALMYHPEIGIDMQIGQKMVYTAEEITEMIESTIVADNRFASVDSIHVEREGNTLRLKLKVSLMHSSKPVPLQLILRSGENG